MTLKYTFFEVVTLNLLAQRGPEENQSSHQRGLIGEDLNLRLRPSDPIRGGNPHK